MGSLLHTFGQELKEIDGFPLAVTGSGYTLTDMCLCFSALRRQRFLLPQQHVHQHVSGVQRHPKLCLSLG